MTTELSVALMSGGHWSAVGLTLLVVALTVGLQYEVLERLNYSMPRWSAIPSRLRLLGMMLLLLVMHVVEIWICGVALFVAMQFPAMGVINGVSEPMLLDCVYLAATTYSTLGYGDLVPQGPVRLLLGTEALLGLLMITWSASFTFLEMQRFWRPR
ncbi:MAG: potassium channel family protein [Oceanococcaceae bacterium]